MRNLRRLTQSTYQKLDSDLVITRLGRLMIRDGNIALNRFLTRSASFNAAVTEGGIVSIGAGMTCNVSMPMSVVQNNGTRDYRYCFDANGGVSSQSVAITASHPTLNRIDIIQAQIAQRTKYADASVDLVNPVTQVVTPSNVNRDSEYYLVISAKAGTPGASPTAPTLDIATAGTVTGTVIIPATIDLTVTYLLYMAVDEDAEYVLIDLRGATPSATTRAEILAKINGAGFGAIASYDGSFHLVFTSLTTGPYSAIRFRQPQAYTNDALAAMTGLSLPTGYYAEYLGTAGYFKLAEVTVPAAATTPSAVIDLTGTWTVESGTTVQIPAYDNHRTQASLDHPAGSVQSTHIQSGSVQSTHIQSSVALAGSPTTTTQAAGDSSTKIATTAFSQNMQSPAFVGIPTSPTAAPGTNTTQIASTAYVYAATSPITHDYLNYGVSSINHFTTLYQQWTAITQYVTARNDAANSANVLNVIGDLYTTAIASIGTVTSAYQLSTVLLPNGKVLIVVYASTTTYNLYLYDPVSNTAVAAGTATISVVAAGQSSTVLLPNGKVLIVVYASTTTYNLYLYDPVSNTAVAAGTTTLTVTGANNSSTVLLPNGQVLIVVYASTTTYNLYLYDPVSNTAVAAGTATITVTSTGGISTVLLPSGLVLIVVYASTTTYNLYLYDPVSNTAVAAGTATITVTATIGATGSGPISTVLLPNGKVLIVVYASTTTYNLYLYDPVSNTAVAAGTATITVTAAYIISTSILYEGRVLICMASSGTGYSFAIASGPFAYGNDYQFPAQLLLGGMI
jgi:hypothetical protein